MILPSNAQVQAQAQAEMQADSQQRSQAQETSHCVASQPISSPIPGMKKAQEMPLTKQFYHPSSSDNQQTHLIIYRTHEMPPTEQVFHPLMWHHGRD